jgi:hypothetical protein
MIGRSLSARNLRQIDSPSSPGRFRSKIEVALRQRDIHRRPVLDHDDVELIGLEIARNQIADLGVVLHQKGRSGIFHVSFLIGAPFLDGGFAPRLSLRGFWLRARHCIDQIK